MDLDFFEVNLAFQNPTYKQITQIKAYDEESFIANVGGYIGMFLGISILQIPDLVNLFYKKTTTAKEAMSKVVRNNFETGIRLVVANMHAMDNQKPSTSVDSTKTSIMPKEHHDIQALSKKIRLLEVKVENLIEHQVELGYGEKRNNTTPKKLQSEILF